MAKSAVLALVAGFAASWGIRTITTLLVQPFWDLKPASSHQLHADAEMTRQFTAEKGGIVDSPDGKLLRLDEPHSNTRSHFVK